MLRNLGLLMLYKLLHLKLLSLLQLLFLLLKLQLLLLKMMLQKQLVVELDLLVLRCWWWRSLLSHENKYKLIKHETWSRSEKNVSRRITKDELYL